MGSEPSQVRLRQFVGSYLPTRQTPWGKEQAFRVNTPAIDLNGS